MIAYQIVDFNSKVSVEYSRISQESFAPAIEAGIISEIIPVQCVTPFTLWQYEDDFNWDKTLVEMEKKGEGTITPTERSGNISHWLLMKQQGETDERFLILEHDAYLTDLGMFEKCIDRMQQHDLCYANLGLFMSCYSYNKHTANWCWELLTEHQLPINCGPYGVAERMFKTYADNYLAKRNYLNKHFTYMTHYKDMEHIGFGKTSQDMFKTYNFRPLDSNDPHPEFRMPSTQVVSKSLKVTQNHHNYDEIFIENPWKRTKAFKVIP